MAQRPLQFQSGKQANLKIKDKIRPRKKEAIWTTRYVWPQILALREVFLRLWWLDQRETMLKCSVCFSPWVPTMVQTFPFTATSTQNQLWLRRADEAGPQYHGLSADIWWVEFCKVKSKLWYSDWFVVSGPPVCTLRAQSDLTFQEEGADRCCMDPDWVQTENKLTWFHGWLSHNRL